jgi:hypothetical protein
VHPGEAASQRRPHFRHASRSARPQKLAKLITVQITPSAIGFCIADRQGTVKEERLKGSEAGATSGDLSDARGLQELLVEEFSGSDSGKRFHESSSVVINDFDDFRATLAPGLLKKVPIRLNRPDPYSRLGRHRQG